MANWDIKDLEYWDAAIREHVDDVGLDCYEQEFEVCDHGQMLGYMAYHGMPAHYPHWSFGKSYEKTKTLYDHGATGLPYEMVINSDPCLGYLMTDNSLCLQILTIAHVYGHNDFFKNNFTFTSATRASETLSKFKTAADRVRDYMEDPSIGIDKVESILDSAHALSMNCNRNAGIRKLKPEEQRQRLIELSRPKNGPFDDLTPREEQAELDLRKVPLEPDEDILLFVRDHNPHLMAWQQDLLTIVHEEAMYFLPQIETKIMNEGWASYWHHKIMNALDLPQDIYMEFLVRHNQVICPHPGGINPYHVGFRVWHDIEERFDGMRANGHSDENPSGRSGREKMFEVRESDRDVSFLRRFLTEDLMRDLDIFEFGPKGDNLVVTKVSDEDNWREVKETLLKSVGMRSNPVIKVYDADYGRNRALYLKHEADDRDLHIGYAEKTLGHLHQLWGHRVLLETVMKGKKTLLSYGEHGFDAKLMR
ncbi:MAG: SpoVR family protein [Alphaproteobacteria bacterium]